MAGVLRRRCAWCGSYQTLQGDWEPGHSSDPVPQLTSDGICPECLEATLDRSTRDRRQSEPMPPTSQAYKTSDRNASAETLGQRLRRLRIARGLSQRDIAEPGTSYAFISRIEAGTRTPSIKAIRKLAAKLDVSPHYLETGELDPIDRYRAENEQLLTEVLFLRTRINELRRQRD
jgi:transcriptional regulator with XRE-family HTH domain